MRFTVLAFLHLVLVVRLSATTDSTIVKCAHRTQLWLPALTATSCIGASLLLDRPVLQFVRQHTSTSTNDITDITDLLGSKTIMVPSLLAVFGGSYLLKDDKLKTTSWNAIRSVVMTSVTIEVLKTGIGRARPFTGEGNGSLHPFDGRDIYKSMPSGHASLAFAIFTPFAETYSRWLYVIPASVALGRVWQQKHWLSDVVVGGGLGWLSGYLLTHSNKKILVTPGGLVVWF